MNPFWSLAVIALLFSSLAQSGSVYKCVQPNKSVIFTDGKCPKNSQETLIHKETPEEIERQQQEEKVATIKRLIADNQPDTAKEFAAKNNLTDTYKEQLTLFLNQKNEEAQQQAAEDRQQQLSLQQQALALQRQQLAIEKSQMQQNMNSNGYGIHRRFNYYNAYSCQSSLGVCVPGTGSLSRNYAPLSSGGMNPPSSSVVQSTWPQATVPVTNARQFLPAQSTAPKK